MLTVGLGADLITHCTPMQYCSRVVLDSKNKKPPPPANNCSSSKFTTAAERDQRIGETVGNPAFAQTQAKCEKLDSVQYRGFSCLVSQY